jgi:diguanylate cyclase (GGDEF)-like protein
MLGWARAWWQQPDHFTWFSSYLDERGLQAVWRWTTFGFTVLLAVLPVVMLASPAGPAGMPARASAVAAAVVAGFGAAVWLLRWPSRNQSLAFCVASMAAIGISCLALSNPYAGLMGCAVFAVVGGFAAYFHTLGTVLLNFVVATCCAAILAYRLAVDTGDVALTVAATITVGALNLGVPFGIQSMAHALRTDLRDSGNDFLTGLFNRRAFYHGAYEMIADPGSGGGSTLIVAMIDLDDFKKLNDSRGHAAGDAALADIGHVLRDNSRPTALLGRMGGEEFVVMDVWAGTPPPDVIERLCMAIAATPFPITASIGTASATLDEWADVSPVDLVDDLMRRADAAMYVAKRAGGNQVRHDRECERERDSFGL